MYFGTPFFYCKKNFIRKAFILLGLFNITKKKNKKNLKKLFTFKKVVYICKVIKNENKMKTTEIKFGKGKDSVTHVIETSKVNEYLIQLANAGWNLSEITKITNL